MLTYADAFECFRVPPSLRPTEKTILKTITDAHTPSELFSHMVICNPRIASKAREQMEIIGIFSDTNVWENDLQETKLAHIL